MISRKYRVYFLYINIIFQMAYTLIVLYPLLLFLTNIIHIRHWNNKRICNIWIPGIHCCLNLIYILDDINLNNVIWYQTIDKGEASRKIAKNINLYIRVINEWHRWSKKIFVWNNNKTKDDIYKYILLTTRLKDN